MKKLLALILILVLVPVISLGDDNPLVGKWSYYFDVGKASKSEQDVLNYSFMINDLYLMEDGAAYMTSATTKKGATKPDFSYGALDGVWLGDASSLVVRVGDQTYKAELSDEGYLLVYITEKIPFPFVKVDTTDKMLELIRE